jgi:hypothetical protein
MSYSLEFRFDYLCLFAPVPDPNLARRDTDGIKRPEGEVVVVVPDLRRAPLRSFKIGAHHPVFRWKKEQQGNSPPSGRKDCRPRVAQHRTLPTQIPSLEVTDLDGELVEIWVDGQKLEGGQPALQHLKSLTSMEEFELPRPEFSLLYNGFLENPPRSQPYLEDDERISLAARIHLRGGSFETERGGLSLEEFFLAKEGKQITPPKRIARQVLWRSEEIDDASIVHILFRKFGDTEEPQYLQLRPANRSQKSVSLSIRNCDEIGDFLLPGLPSYAAIENHEPQVYQTLSAGYTGFGSITKISHLPVTQSANSVCAPVKTSGTG